MIVVFSKEPIKPHSEIASGFEVLHTTTVLPGSINWMHRKSINNFTIIFNSLMNNWFACRIIEVPMISGTIKSYEKVATSPVAEFATMVIVWGPGTNEVGSKLIWTGRVPLEIEQGRA